MMKYGNKEKWLKIVLYIAVIVMINLVSETLFFRIDLTGNKVFSLSGASKNLVASLEEPLTIRVFLSENLPQPYNNLEQQVKDLMEEYALAGNKNFNYSLYLLDQEGIATDKSGRNLRDMAEDYGIPSIQIQNVEQDEVKLQSAYMGMVLIQGDLMETIPALAKETNLEYRITSVINKISRKTSTMLAMADNVDIELVLSPELLSLSRDLEDYGKELEKMVQEMNKQNFGRLQFRTTAPSSFTPENLKQYGLNRISLESGSETAPETSTAYAGVVIRYGDNAEGINLLNRGIFGYTITPAADLEQPVGEIIEKLIGVNQSIGYLSDHGTAPLYSNPYAQQQVPGAANFNQLMSGDYNVKSVTPGNIPGDVKTLIINGPKETFSDWELFQLDQFIMKGGSVAFFMDAFNEILPSQQQMMYGQMPQYTPLETGLEKLLSHYGATLHSSYVMDEDCFKQQSRDANGGIQETPIYFAPKISLENINGSLPFMKNIKGLITLNASPIEITAPEDSGMTAEVLFHSSATSWTVSENINLYNPATIFPPSEEQRGPENLAVLLEGKLSSYFTGKEIPEPPRPEETGDQEEEGSVAFRTGQLRHEEDFVSETEGGRLFLTGTSTLLSDNLLDAAGTSTNATMVQNVIDHLNGWDDYAVMRSKGQGYNPLPDVDTRTKTFLKGLNIVFLPVLVILIGLIMWFYWNARKRKIAEMYK